MEKIDVKHVSLRGKIASIIGIFVNILLASSKILVGILFGLISVVADGLNNLTDCGSSIVSFVSFKLSSKPADKEHPFGHERIEYICSLSVAFLVLIIAFDTIKESISKIIEPTGIEFSYWIIAVLVFSIIAKLFLFIYYKTTAKKINSVMLSATAIDSLSDCVSTFVTLVSFIISISFGIEIDGYAGIIVALFMAWSAIGLLRDIFSNLIGKAPDKKLINDIKDKILSYEGVLSVHDLSVYCYGPNKYFASAHIEVPASVDVLISHELIDEIERDFFENTNIVLTGHLDPIETENPEVVFLRERVACIVNEIDHSYSIHDLRIVKGEKRTNVIFDVAIPYDSKLSKEQIISVLDDKIKDIDKAYQIVVTVEYCV